MTDELNLENVDSVNDLADFDAADISVDAANVENADAADTVVVEDASENSENVAGETESPAEPAETVAGDSSAAQEVDPTDAGAAAVAEFSKTLRTLEGKWYVLHTYSGYEKRVKTNVESRVQSFGLEDKIFQIEVPMEEVEKHTDKGKKVITRV
ncbi:transcription termination/antitermination factor NusG, partial [Gardnerella vaginalis]